MRGGAAVLVGLLALSGAFAAQAPGGPAKPYVDSAKAYLFAHMTKEHYGELFYSVSLDGLHWTRLNGGKPVSAAYHGHASIARSNEGRYYLVGNKGDDDPLIRFWVSNDLVRWTSFGTYQPDLKNIHGHPHTLQRIGAPKLFYDDASRRFLLTWHTPNLDGSTQDPERYWGSQRTLYVESDDLKTFAAPPRRLFTWDMATIDTIVQPNDHGGYCVIIKDERYPSYSWPTGKTIRISCARKLLGPYPFPASPLSPNFREAPTIIRAPNKIDWLLYYEQYAGTSYGLSMAPTLRGPWYQVSGNSGVPEWNRYEMPAGTRHGSMIGITRQQYDAIVAAFPNQ
jgi:hypothetical protein